jgi:hypothetical protein
MTSTAELTGASVKVLPPRNEEGRKIADRFGITGLTGTVLESDDDHATVLLACGVVWRLELERIALVRDVRQSAAQGGR